MISLLIFLFTTFGSSDKNVKEIPFNLEQPDLIISLPAELREVSGLSFFQSHLWAIQDEKGRVYKVELSPPYNVKERKFWKSGDFEGIEYVNGYLYMIKSNGNLYISPIDDISEDETEKIDPPFQVKTNIEGLGYHPKSNNLLIADKGQQNKPGKAIYGFSLSTLSLHPEPLFKIDEMSLKAYLHKKNKSWFRKITSKVSLVNYTFNPSAIATDPISKNIYVLSSPNAQLLVLNPNWKIVELIFLPRALNMQPEGICFDQAGNLYISNEGKSGKGTISKFERNASSK